MKKKTARMVTIESKPLFADTLMPVIKTEEKELKRVRIGAGITATMIDQTGVSQGAISGTLTHSGSKAGFFGSTPVTQPAAYSPTNVTSDRAYDANATSTAELADVLGTLISDLQSLGLIS